MGFVEVCLGDLPLNRDVEGWFELRHKDGHAVYGLGFRTSKMGNQMEQSHGNEIETRIM